jgi:hypothetical protein
MSVPVFKDLDKSALDLITKGFPTDSHGFEVEGGSDETVKFKATGTHTAAALNTLFETTKQTSYGVTLKATAKADKNVPVYSIEGAYEPKAVAGLKVTVNSECKIPQSGEVATQKVTFLYKKDKVTVEDSISYSAGTVSFAGSLALAYQSVRAGAHALASVTVSDKAFALGGYGFKLGYVPSKELSLIASFDKGEKGTTAGATLFYKKSATEAAGQVVIDPSKPAALPGFIAALSHSLDSKTTLKAKLATAKPLVAVSLKHQLSDALSVTLASEAACPVAKEGEKACCTSHKHGLSLNLKL